MAAAAKTVATLEGLFAARAPPPALDATTAGDACVLREELSGAQAVLSYSSGEYLYRLDGACVERTPVADSDPLLIRIEEEVSDLTGCRIWDTCVLMAKYFEKHFGPGGDQAGALIGKRILELGAGAGLLGCVLAALGAHVTVTEQAGLVPLCERNVRANGFRDCCDVRELKWGTTDLASFRDGAFDLIVGSDVLLHARLAPQLFDVLSELAVRRPRCASHPMLSLAYSTPIHIRCSHTLSSSTAPRAGRHHRGDNGTLPRARWHAAIRRAHR
jgi:predicted nicotinamide N-methyase